MTQSKTIYGIEQHMVEGMPQAIGKMHVMKAENVPHLLDSWDFRYAVIHMARKLMVFFPTEEAAKRHLDECSMEVGPNYLKNFNLKGA